MHVLGANGTQGRKCDAECPRSNTKSSIVDNEQNTSDLKDKVRTQVHQTSTRINQTMDNVQQQLMNYGNQIQKLLGNYSADVQDYGFSVEMKREGLSIDVAFKASILPKDAAGTV